MRQVGPILSLFGLLAHEVATLIEPPGGLFLPQPALIAAGEHREPRFETRSRTPVSPEERRVVIRYYDCAMTAARRSNRTGDPAPAVALSALYSCPTERADAQALVIRNYGFGRKQAMFRALDQRILRDAEAVVMQTRSGK